VTNGFARAAERDATLLDLESRKVIEAYARGVNQFIDTTRIISLWNFLSSTTNPSPGNPPILWRSPATCIEL